MSTRVPSVPIEFGGKTRHLIYDFNAKAELYDVAGTFVSPISSGASKLKLIRASAWACLLAETLDARGSPTKDTLNIMQVGDILASMSKEQFAEVEAKITDAMKLGDLDFAAAIEAKDAEDALEAEAERPLAETPELPQP